ncbi:MAG TPA: signal peptidase I [Kineosporiaceae bacterium]|nr:signal peptidase I [Kineosporiaceae bacterium]
MTEPWDTGRGAGWDGWAPSAETKRPLRQHTQPRHEDDADGTAPAPYRRLPTRRLPDPSSFDPELTALDTPHEDGGTSYGAHRVNGVPDVAGPRDAAQGAAHEVPGVGAAGVGAAGVGAAGVGAAGVGARPFDDPGRAYDIAPRPLSPRARVDRGLDLATGLTRPAPRQPRSRMRVGPRHGTAGRRADPGPKSPLRAALGAVGEVVVVLGMALLLSLLIKTFLVQAFFIPSTSMENTLLVGDRVLVSKLTPGIFSLHRGDVVVFKDPGGWLTAEESAPAQDQGGVGGTVRNALSFVGLLPQDAGEHLIKRVIGVGGDHVQCCDAQGRVLVNGIAIDETPYLIPGAAPSDKAFTVTVPYGYLWVMGDNRPVSADSRLHRALNNGMVPLHDVVGKAFVIVWPFDRAGGLGAPATVFQHVPQPATR